MMRIPLRESDCVITMNGLLTVSLGRYGSIASR